MEDVLFEPFFNRKGEFIEYRSFPIAGRKVIVVRGENSLADLDRGYRVRVVNDTRPAEPSKGALIVEVLPDAGPADELKHKEAAHSRQQHLRQSRGFDVMAAMINADPDLSAEYRPMVARHKEFREGLHRSPEDRHRNYTGMMAGLMMSDRGNAMLNRVIDRTIDMKSDAYKTFIEARSEKENPVYVRGIVAGAGPYGSILAHTRQMYMPNAPDLTLEKERIIGGQFAQYETDLFRLNSRTRPERLDEPHVPGTRQSLNSMGEFAVMQPADTSGEAYAYQRNIADTARVNFFLSGEAMTRVELRKMRRSDDPGLPGAITAEYLDLDKKKVFNVRTDRVTFAAGLGKDRTGLNERDRTTASILLRENQKFEKGEDARVLSFTQFGKKMSDPSDPFPIKDMKRLVLSGDKDSANVIAGIVLGYESQIGKTATQLDRVEQIIWIGQKFETKEEFLQNSRARYAQVGLEFPRARFEEYYSRIIPITGVRSDKLRRTPSGGVRVMARRSGPSGFREPLEEEYEGDYFIYAHGFEDQTDRIIASMFNTTITGRDRISDTVRKVGTRPENYIGTEFFYEEGSLRSIEILAVDGDDESVAIATVAQDGSYEETTVSTPRLRAYVEADTIKSVQVPQTASPNGMVDIFEDTVIETVRGSKRPIAKMYRPPSGGEIYKVGPVSNLPLTREEIAQTPVFRSIPENTAAIFRYVDYAEALATKLALEDLKRGAPRSALFDAVPEREEIVLPSREEARVLLAKVDIALPDATTSRIGLSESSADLLKLSMGDALANFVFSEDLNGIQIDIIRTSQENGVTNCTLVFDPPLPQQYTNILEAGLKDPLAASVVKKITDNTRSHAVRLTIPLVRGKVQAAGISYSTSR